MELINGNSEIIKDFFQSMERMLEGIGKLVKESKPHLNGESFGNQEASKYLKARSGRQRMERYGALSLIFR